MESEKLNMEAENKTAMEEGNKLIAEFMGVKFNNGMWFFNGYGKFPSDLAYNKSWDWLMPVVKEVYKIDGSFGWFVAKDFYDANIENVFNAIVKYLKWYNTQN